jgi:hypothetical protein
MTAREYARTFAKEIRLIVSGLSLMCVGSKERPRSPVNWTIHQLHDMTEKRLMSLERIILKEMKILYTF